MSAGAAPSGGFGRLGFGFLAVSVLSGVALVPFYSPAHALDSLERLHGGLPWGFLLRALHAYASFGVLATGVAHVVQVLAARTERQLAVAVWWRSVVLLPLTTAALLGGFILRGDAEASAALAVARRILDGVPLAGPFLPSLLLGASADLGVTALHHAGTFTLLVWLLTAEHGGRLLPDARAATLAGLVSFALAGAVPLALGPPPGTATPLLLGPWYLLGLQGALVDLPAATGWLAPVAAVALLGSIRHMTGRARSAVLALLGAALAADLAFTVRLVLLARS